MSSLVARAEAGEEILIARAGKPVARLVPVPANSRARTPGLWRGWIHIRAGFDQIHHDLLGSFEG